MTKLLVSVRDGQEALAALVGRADLIDVKEPGNGALGAGSARQLAEVASTVAGRAPLSAALGEMLDDQPDRRLADLAGYSFVKVGMAGCSAMPSWPQRWSQFVEQVPRNIHVVAVIYADYVTARAPAPCELLDVAQQLGISYVLVDTFNKSAGDLLSISEIGDLSAWIARAQASNMQVAVAGSLTLRQIPFVASLRPDFIAVRGGVCRGGRSGQVDSSLVGQIARLLSTTDAPKGTSLRAEFVDADVRAT